MSLDEDIKRLLRSEKPFAFLVGGGISIPYPSSMLSGQRFTEEIVSRVAPDEDTKEELLKLCISERRDKKNKGDFLRFESLMEILQEDGDPHLDVLNHFVAYDKPNENHYLLAELIQRGHYVFTTNFDVLIERACEELGISYSVFITEEGFKTYTANEHPYPLFKLHGSLKKRKGDEWLDAKDSIKATLNAVGRAGEYMRFEPGKRKVFTDILQTHDVVVLGYSGYDDFDIGPLLTSIESGRRIIWINHEERKRARKRRWGDIDNAKEKSYRNTLDDNDYFLRKHEEILYELGTKGYLGKRIRNPNNIFLFDIDTARVVVKFKKLYGIHTPDLGRDSEEQRKKREGEVKGYFDEWQRKYISDDWLKSNLCGRIFISLYRYDLALDNYQRSLEIAEATKDKGGMATSLNNIGIIQGLKGDYSQALANFQKSLEISQDLGNVRGISSSLHHIGILQLEKEEYDKAFETHQKTLKLSEEINDPVLISISLGQIGVIFAEKKDYERALEYYQKAGKIAEEIGELESIAITEARIGTIHVERGEYHEAIINYYASLKIFEELGNRVNISKTLFNIGEVWHEMKQHAFALEKYNESLKIEEELGNEYVISQILYEIGTLYQDIGKYKQAFKKYNQSLELSQKLGDKISISKVVGKIGTSKVVGKIGTLHHLKGETTRALEKYHLSMQISQEINNQERIIIALQHIGFIHYEQGAYSKAEKMYKESLKIGEKLANKDEIMRTLEMLILLYQDQNDLKEDFRYTYYAYSLATEINSPHLNAINRRLERIKQDIGGTEYERLLPQIKKGVEKRLKKYLKIYK